MTEQLTHSLTVTTVDLTLGIQIYACLGSVGQTTLFYYFLGSDYRSGRFLVLLLDCDAESDNLTVSGFTREQQLMETISRYKPMMSSVTDRNWSGRTLRHYFFITSASDTLDNN